MEQYDIIFMDIEMPEMDGIQASAEIKRLIQNDIHLYYKKYKIVLCSAHEILNDYQILNKSKADITVGKPISIQKLQNIFSQIG